MNIDILHDIMKLSRDKKETLCFFLDKKIKNSINDCKLIRNIDNLYLNDNVFCIKKNTLHLEYKGKIKFINQNIITIITHGSQYSININFKDYHILVKPLLRKNNNSDREFYESLLKML
jgi:hypothetical protein